MHFLQITIDNCEWFGQNFVYNLDFIPDDKLNWKPSETAKSALEIAGEVIGVFGYMQESLESPGEKPTGDYSAPTSREEAKEKILAASNKYADFLRSLKPADIEGEIAMNSISFPKARLVHMPVQDLNHHHGQITYLQTIWGDKQSHFFEFKS